MKKERKKKKKKKKKKKERKKHIRVGVARCNFVVEHPLMAQWVVGSIVQGGPIELYIQCSTTKAMVRAILSVG